MMHGQPNIKIFLFVLIATKLHLLTSLNLKKYIIKLWQNKSTEGELIRNVKNQSWC